MGLVVLCYILMPFIFPLSEEENESMGFAGAMLCASMWLSFIIVYSIIFLWYSTQRSVAAALVGCILSWVPHYIIYDLYRSYVVLFYAVSPAILTFFTIRMFWYIRELGRTPPPAPCWYYPMRPPWEWRP